MANEEDVPRHEVQCKNQSPNHEASYLQQHHGLREFDMPGPSSMHDVPGPSCGHDRPPPPPPPPLAPSLDDNLFSTASTSTSSDSKLPSSMSPQIPISWPNDGTLTVSWVADLMQTFDWASGALHKEPNCVRINENSGLDLESRVVVVGDVHGQLHDVLFLLKDAGFPSDDRFFVFNGNYVDREAWGLEVFLIFLAWKVLMPQGIFTSWKS